jgi:3-hydroxyisobutyrate dehydrogenase-like beta-hydroxyacid dehydrogenase
MEKDVCGFVGTGRMGAPMCARLLSAGFAVHIYDANEAAVVALEKLGAQRAASAAAVGDAADTVFLSLPTPEIVHAVATGSDGVGAGKRAKRVVDLSTIGRRMAGLVHQALAERGITYIDAPVSGGVKGAREGTLAVMVSCAKETFPTIEAIAQHLGKVFHVGEQPGQGQTMKLANNLLSAIAVAATSEVMVMGVKAGLDPRLMLEVINAGSGRNTASQFKFPQAILPGTFDVGFATALSYKDTRLCMDEAEALGVPMVFGGAIRQMLAVTQAMYGPDSDFTSLCRVIESWAGVEVRG